MSYRRFMQTYGQTLIGVGMAGLFMGKLAPHTLFQYRYKDFFHLYNPDGTYAELDDSVQTLVEQVLKEDLDIHPSYEQNTFPFPTSGMDLIYWGSINLRSGGLIGIPCNFSYKSVGDIRRDKIQVRNQPIDWDSKKGKELANSLVLSDKAKKFAIARQFFYVKTNYPVVQSTAVGGYAVLAYALSFATNRFLRLHQKTPTAVRFGFYCFYTLTSLTLYTFTKDAYNNYLDKFVDRNAGGINLEYAEGGVEFYEKQLLRNSAMRVLLPEEEGKEWYTQYGNQIALWRSPHFPLTGRKANLMKQVEEFKSKPKEVKVSLP